MHYRRLGKTNLMVSKIGFGVECIGCGGCETRCPFGMKITERMEKAADLFA